MPRRSREFWVSVVAALERSGDHHREFAARRGLKVTTLQSWLYRLRRERTKSVPLVPVRVVASTAPAARETVATAPLVEVELPSGVRLRFPAGTDDEYVGALVQRLG